MNSVCKRLTTIVSCIGTVGLLSGYPSISWGSDGLFHEAAEYFAARTKVRNPFPPNRHARRVHDNAPFIIDLHADTLMHPNDGGVENYRLTVNRNREGHVDINKLIEGNVALQVFAVPTKASLDLMGTALPWATGVYVDHEGVQGEPGTAYSRYEFQRDPNRAEYDDPDQPYVDRYKWLLMERDFGSYLARTSGLPCSTWDDGKPWRKTWGYTPDCPEMDVDNMYLNRKLATADRLLVAAEKDDRIRIVRSEADIDDVIWRRSEGIPTVGAMLATEGLYFPAEVETEEGVTALNSAYKTLYEKGFRMFALTHFLDNDFGGSCNGMGRAHFKDGRGLQPAGKHFMHSVIEHDTIIDLAHASRATFNDLIHLARNEEKPVIVSHGGLAELPGADERCAQSRNLYDQEVLELASTGGVVGIGFAEAFICDIRPIGWARAVRHAVDTIDRSLVQRDQKPTLCSATDTECQQQREEICSYATGNDACMNGVDHVALGTDYDGGVEAWTDIDDLNQYTEALVCKKSWWRPNCLEKPFTEEEAHKILGLNSLRVMREVLP